MNDRNYVYLCGDDVAGNSLASSYTLQTCTTTVANYSGQVRDGHAEPRPGVDEDSPAVRGDDTSGYHFEAYGVEQETRCGADAPP